MRYGATVREEAGPARSPLWKVVFLEAMRAPLSSMLAVLGLAGCGGDFSTTRSLRDGGVVSDNGGNGEHRDASSAGEGGRSSAGGSFAYPDGGGAASGGCAG